MGRDDTRIQFVHDEHGKTTAVLMPIDLWQEMVQDNASHLIPEWHKEEVRKTLAETKPEDLIPLETFLQNGRRGKLSTPISINSLERV
jgi:hypothetical protein